MSTAQTQLEQRPLEQRTKLATSTSTKTDFEKLLDKEQRSISYVPLGGDDAIKLTIPLVQSLLCEKTKSGKTCSENDAKKFITMCMAMRLNPFERDAFIVGYDTKQFDGTWSPKFSIIIAHQAYLKRAEASPNFDGMDSGIVIQVEDGKLIERDTDFALPEEKVVGGWAVVYRRDRSRPLKRMCTVANKKPKFDSNFWSDEKTPEMVCKAAEADALRSAFPTLIGGLVGGDIDVTERFVQPSNGRAASSLVETVSAPQRETQPAKPDPDPGRPQTETEATDVTKQALLAEFVIANGFTFSDLQKYGLKEELIPGADSLASFDDVPESIAKRLLMAKSGLLAGLKQMKMAAA